MYEIITDELGRETIVLIDDNGEVFWIPSDVANVDYQAYLASLEEPTA